MKDYNENVDSMVSLADEMIELADKGLSVILTSSELPELVNLPDRCIVLYKGRMAAEFSRETMDSEKIVAAQIGQSTGGYGVPG